MPLACHPPAQATQTTTRHDDNNQKEASYQTPPPTREGSSMSLEQTFQEQESNNGMNSTAQRKISPMPPSASLQDEDQDYLLFVQSLGQEEDPMMNLASLVVEEEEEDFVLTDLDDDDDDDEDEDDLLGLASFGEDISPSNDATATTESTGTPSPSPLFENSDFYSQLEAELGSLLEEDLEAAVSTLLSGSNKLDHSSKQRTSHSNTTSLPPQKESSPCLKGAVETPHVTQAQVEELQQLMHSHYQLLVQSSVLAVRAARKEFPEESPLVFHQGETPEELTMTVLDGAVGMLQDLDQCRKDAIRNYIQRCETSTPAQRSLFFTGTNKRLTRSAFSTLQESTNAHTIFDVDGLYQLKQTFRTIDNCGTQREGLDILEPIQHWDACRRLLEQAGAKIDDSLLPGKRDLHEIVSDAREVFGQDFVPPTSIPQQIILRRNRNQFTAAEDNLVLRGVNLYGEKQWILIADRFLPDRSVNIISQRYSKICVLLYKAHGVEIDANGNLPTPPRFDKVDQLDQEAISKIKPAAAPAVLNVHRWSLEEDITLLKSVPLLGNQWAELSNRIIPHRDRGHLRKRYQVLERRIKATVTRSKRSEAVMLPRTTPILVSTQRPPATKTTVLPKKRKGGPVKPPMLPLNGSIIRGPVPAHLLCPSNGRGSKAKQVGKTMDFARHSSASAKRPLPTNGKCNTNGNGGYASQTSGPVNGGYASHSGAPAPTPMANNGGYANYPGASPQPNRAYPYHPGSPAPNMGYMNHPGAPHPPPPANYTNHPGAPPAGNYAPAHAIYATTPRASPGGYATSQASPHVNASYNNHWDGSNHEASRFENLLTGATDDWSQLSRMQRMMDNEQESMAASAIKSLAMGTRDLPPPQNLERLPQMEIHSSSGFSQLNDKTKSDDKNEPQNVNDSFPAEKGSKTPPAKQQNGSILASVLERTRKDDVQENAIGQENSVSSEQAPVAKVPSTPSRPLTNLSQLPDYGTPLGASPGAGLHMQTFYSPGGHKNGESPGFKTTFSPAPFHSPGPMHSLMGGVGGGNSNDYNEMYPFEITEKSRQVFGEGSNHATEPLTPSNGLLHDHHDLKATDLDAISALNSLSNSPAKFPPQRPATDDNDEEQGKKDTIKKSLFAAAIGAVEQERKKRRTK